MSTQSQIHQAVRERYAATAREVLSAERESAGKANGLELLDLGTLDVASGSCCSPTPQASACCAESNESSACCDSSCCATHPESIGYAADDVAALPDGAVKASLGCGNPMTLANLQPGQTVLDLGSGGGIDVLLSARRVGPTGKAYGLDMTDEMLELARSNARKAGATNVEFLKGQIESIPLPDNSVDVIISNCVINLSPDKDAVLREAFRVLRPGGQFAVSDVVVQGEDLPESVRSAVNVWSECLGGALTDSDYRAKLIAAGFTEISIEAINEYATDGVLGAAKSLVAPNTSIVSAAVRARKS